MEEKNGVITIKTNKTPFIITSVLLFFWGFFPLMIIGFMFFVSKLVGAPIQMETHFVILNIFMSVFFLGFFVYVVFFSNMRKPAMILDSDYITLFPHFKREQKIAWHDIKHIYLSWWRPGSYTPKIFKNVVETNMYVLDIGYKGKQGKNEQVIRRLNSIDISREDLKKFLENYPVKVQCYDEEGTYPKEYEKKYFDANIKVLLPLGIFMVLVGAYSNFSKKLSFPILTIIMNTNVSETNIILICGGAMFILAGGYQFFSLTKTKKDDSKFKKS